MHPAVLTTLLALCQSCQRPESPPQPLVGSAAPTQSSVIATLTRPTAAALSADGKTLYVLAQDDADAYQLYSGAVGGALSVVPTSQPLAYPVALAVRREGQELFIADLGASDATSPSGVLYRSTTSGALTGLAGSVLQAPTALALATDDQSLYVTARDAQTGEPGVWQISIADGVPTRLYQGPPLAQPLAIAQTQDGSVYVADAQGSSLGTGALFRIAAGQALAVSKSPLALTFPSGLCAAGRPTADLLLSTPLLTGTEPWLLRMSPSGAQDPVVLPNATEVTSISRAADADLWVAIDAVIPAAAADADPQALERPQGHVLLLAP